ncbi:MAG: hypothetical protein JWP11_864 [Frankiales bacterium]|nr:hypothetical protein [Frankiales bacterium]
MLHIQVGTAGYSTAPVAFWVLDRAGQPIERPDLVVQPAGVFAPQTNATGSPAGCTTLPVQPETVCESRAGNLVFVDVTIPASRTDARRLVIGLVADDRLTQVSRPARGSGWHGGLIHRRLQLLRAADVADLYVSSNSQTIEHFTHATAAGGSGGSLAVAAVPCQSLSTAQTGQGSAQLTGGTRPVGLGCAPGSTVISGAAASRSTIWALAGDVWGTTNTAAQLNAGVALTTSPEDIRLLVVNGPF